MVTTITRTETPMKHTRALDREFFDPQPTSRSELPEPDEIMRRLAFVAVEILAGTRSIDQIARWVSEDVYRAFAERARLARRARGEKGTGYATRPPVSAGRIVSCEPRDGIVEGVCLVTIGPRTRSVCMRLEGLDHRWRATVLALL